MSECVECGIEIDDEVGLEVCDECLDLFIYDSYKKEELKMKNLITLNIECEKRIYKGGVDRIWVKDKDVHPDDALIGVIRIQPEGRHNVHAFFGTRDCASGIVEWSQAYEWLIKRYIWHKTDN